MKCGLGVVFAAFILVTASPPALSQAAAPGLAATDTLRECSFPAVDTTGWQSTMGIAVGIAIRHPPRYRRKIWGSVSDSTKRYLEIQKDGSVMNSRLIVESSQYVERGTGFGNTTDSRCLLHTRAGTLALAYGPRGRGRCTGCPPPPADLGMAMRFRHPKTGKQIVLHALARDSADFYDHVAIAASLRFLSLP